jgi:hypothetical protein
VITATAANAGRFNKLRIAWRMSLKISVHDQSCLSASSGSIRLARQAGIKQANQAELSKRRKDRA